MLMELASGHAIIIPISKLSCYLPLSFYQAAGIAGK